MSTSSGSGSGLGEALDVGWSPDAGAIVVGCAFETCERVSKLGQMP